MEVTLVKFMFMLTNMVSQKKHVKHMSLKTLINSHALIFRDVKTVLLQQVKNLEIKVTVGLNQNIQSGKLVNMDQFQELIK